MKRSRKEVMQQTEIMWRNRSARRNLIAFSQVVEEEEAPEYRADGINQLIDGNIDLSEVDGVVDFH
jgi:hypothetical protein